MTDLAIADDCEMLRVQRVAELLDVHAVTVRRWIDRGELPAVRIGATVRVRRADLERVLQERLVLTG